MPAAPQAGRLHHRGFTLLEVLIAVGILGLALIGVAAVFPVGATWTRQAIEDTVAQNVALNAVNIIKTNYVYTDFAVADTLVHAVPSQVAGGRLPIAQRAYAFNQAVPYPATDSATSEYYWTALYRVPYVGSHNIAVYIFVYRIGDPAQTFTAGGELAGDRDTSEPCGTAGGPPYHGFPELVSATYNIGALAGNDVAGAVPPVGTYGITATDGRVFRQGLNANATAADSRIGLVSGTDAIYWAPPPDNWPNSPLIYVYQTTISF